MFKTANPLDPALARNRDTLLGIVAMLASMVGVGRIEKALRLQVLRILRPAEAAVRRLIFVVARGVVVAPARVCTAADFQGLRGRERLSDKLRRASFQLADPMVPMVGQQRDVGEPRRPPRIRIFTPIDPTVPALMAAQRVKPPKPDPEDVRSAALLRRLQAIAAALEDLPKQAKRLVRWTARREKISEQRPVYTSPLRPGPPPGYRREPVSDIDRILAACHLRAFDARLLKPG